jgi:hypothetical protein
VLGAARLSSSPDGPDTAPRAGYGHGSGEQPESQEIHALPVKVSEFFTLCLALARSGKCLIEGDLLES